MSVDLAITGGVVVDGSGAPARPADVGIRDGRIVEVAEPGTVAGASRVIDAAGLVVAPGFVDLHTHYDAQLFWDPTASPSPLHGVTTVLGGNCGFSLAPAGAEHVDYLSRMMARVEGIPIEALEEGCPWDWDRFGEYLDRLEGRIAVNAGFLAGHSAIRRAVMGDDATAREATSDEVAQMCARLHESLEGGALGFSSSRVHTHHDGDGQPVPSRHASLEELRTLAAIVGHHEGTTLEMIVAGCINGFDDEEIELLGDLSLAAGRPLNWNVLAVTGLNPDGHRRQLEASTAAAARGGRVVALTLPQGFNIRLSFLTGVPLDGLPGWRATFALPLEERLRALSDPEVRRRLQEGARSPEAGLLAALANWEILTFVETFAEETSTYEGRTVGDVARERGQEPFDALLDVVVADRLRTGLRPPELREDEEGWRMRAEVWRSPHVAIGGSDAGAHLDMMCGATYTTFLVGEAVRDLGLVSLEEAVRLLTDVPARLYGLRDRGRVAAGFHADLVLFDPERVAPHQERLVADLPGGTARLFAGAEGIEHVLVNGIPIAGAGRFTGESPGAVLRSGRDTETVAIPGG